MQVRFCPSRTRRCRRGGVLLHRRATFQATADTAAAAAFHYVTPIR